MNIKTTSQHEKLIFILLDDSSCPHEMAFSWDLGCYVQPKNRSHWEEVGVPAFDC